MKRSKMLDELYRVYRRIAGTTHVSAGSNPHGTTLLAGTANVVLHIQRIFVSVAVNAAQTWTFVGSTSGRKLAAIDGTNALGDVHVLLVSDDGVALDPGEGLVLQATGAGIEGCIAVEGYRKDT